MFSQILLSSQNDKMFASSELKLPLRFFFVGTYIRSVTETASVAGTVCENVEFKCRFPSKQKCYLSPDLPGSTLVHFHLSPNIHVREAMCHRTLVTIFLWQFPFVTFHRCSKPTKIWLPQLSTSTTSDWFEWLNQLADGCWWFRGVNQHQKELIITGVFALMQGSNYKLFMNQSNVVVFLVNQSLQKKCHVLTYNDVKPHIWEAAPTPVNRWLK